jgi:hypothetical protein
MPLDAYRKGFSPNDETFHQSIRREGHRLKPFANPGDALVVQAVHRDLISPEDVVQEAAGGQADSVGMFIAWVSGEPVVLEGVGQLVCEMGVEAAAKSDIQDLRTAADRQEGQVAAQGKFEQIEFKSISFRVHVVDFGVGAAIKTFGLDIAAAGEEDAIQVVNEVAEAGFVQPGGDQEGDPAGQEDGFNIGPSQLEDFCAGSGLRVPACDPDDGLGCSGHGLSCNEKTSSGINNDQKMMVGLSPDEVLGWETSQRDILIGLF